MRTKKHSSFKSYFKLSGLFLLLFFFTNGISLAQSLEITTFSPNNGASSVNESANIGLKFNATVDHTTFTKNSVKIRGSQSGIITATFPGSDSSSPTINPNSDFKPGETVTVFFDTSIKDVFGNTLNKPYTIRFIVGTIDIAPSVLISSNTIDAANSWSKEISAADIDDDGDMDLFSVSPTDDLVEWHENNGSQSFTQHTINSTLDNPYAIKAIDMDDDGDIDAVGTVLNEDKIVWFENDGSENFTTHTISISADEANEVMAIDVDSDGDMDVISSSTGDDTIAWYENNGSESFTERIISAAVDGANAIYAIDMDNDGDVDILTAAYTDRELIWFENNGSQTFTKHVISVVTRATQIRAADINGDSHIDVLATAAIDGDVMWLENDGSQSFTKRFLSFNAGNAQNIEAADYDGDGDIDIISTGSKLYVYENDGSENFTTKIQSVPDFPTALTLADVDGDSKMDIITSNDTENTIRWHKLDQVPLEVRSTTPSNLQNYVGLDSNIQIGFNVPVNPGSLSSSILIKGSVTGAISGTFTGGNSETITFNPTQNFRAGEIVTISITTGLTTVLGANLPNSYQFQFTAASTELVENPTGSYDELPLGFNLNSPQDITAADLDNDGDLDMLFASEDDNIIAWFENDGNQVFSKHVISSTLAGAFTVDVADVDSDGDLDVIGGGDTHIYWFSNNGSEVFTEQLITSSASNVSVLQASDIDGDGDIDIVKAENGNDDLVVFENNGSESFTEQEIANSLNNPSDFEIADIDGDGDLDIALSSLSDGRIDWFRNDGSGSFTKINVSTNTDGIRSIFVTDLDDDGDGDILSASDLGDNIAWHRNNGSSFSKFVISSTTAGQTSEIVAADIDGDGDNDVISFEIAFVGSLRIDAVTIFENNGSENFTGTEIGREFSISALIVEDIDNNGTLEIIFSSESGDVISWLEYFESSDRQSITFDGTTGVADISSVANDISGANTFSLEFWFKPNFTNQLDAGEVALLGIHDNSNQDKLIIKLGDDAIQNQVLTVTDGSTSITSPALTNDQWYHLVYSLSSGTGTLFLDGKQVGQHSTALTFASDDIWSLGRKYDGAESDFFRGDMDEIRLWNDVRSLDEIRNNMYQKLNRQDNSLIAYWPVNEGSGSTLFDKTVNANNATLTGISWDTDQHPFGTFITGNEGWRMLGPGFLKNSSLPRYNTLLNDSLWIQGITNGDTDSGTPNVYTWDEATKSFEAVLDLTSGARIGEGFIVYVYDDIDYDQNPDGFPKNLEYSEEYFNQVSSDQTKQLTYNDTGDATVDGFNLLANPYQNTIDWNEAGSFIRDQNSNPDFDNLDETIYIWSDSANAGTGAYLSWNRLTGTLPNGKIAPMQAFWVKANTEMEIKLRSSSESHGGVLYKRSPSGKESVSQIKFSLSSENMVSRTVVMFNEQSDIEKDKFDAYKLSSLNQEHLSLFSLLPDGTSLDINALPSEFESLEIPIDFTGSDLNGKFSLKWNRLHFSENWNISIFDNETGHEVNMKEASSINFSLNSVPKKINKEFKIPSFSLVSAPGKTKSKDPRFVMKITSSTSVSNESNFEIPSIVELQQNYPNPFNPSTTITFGVPEAGEVTLEVFDLLGRKVVSLLNRENKSAGRYSVHFDAQNLSSGMYIYRLQAGNITITKKLTLIK